MSSAVPNVASVLKKGSSSPVEVAQRERHEEQGGGVERGRRLLLHAGVGPQLGRAGPRPPGRRGHGRWRRSRLRRCALYCARFVIRGARPSGCRLTRSALAGGRQQLGSDPIGEDGQRGPVGRDEVPPVVDDHGGEGLVAGEDGVERGADRRHRTRLERRLGVDRRVPGREQQAVAVPQRHVEVLGQVERRARGSGATGRSRRSSGGGWRPPPRGPGRAGSAVGAAASPAAGPRRRGEATRRSCPATVPLDGAGGRYLAGNRRSPRPAARSRRRRRPGQRRWRRYASPRGERR